MQRRRVTFALAATIIFMNVAGFAYAQLRPIQPIDRGPVPVRTIIPFATPTPGTGHRSNSRVVPSGTRVPLSLLPALPVRTQMNTMSQHNRRPMAADGSTITLTQSSGCTGTSGVLYNVNCQVTWVASNVPSATDTYQYYYVPPSSGGTGTAGGSFTGTPTSQGPTTLSAGGVWTFGVYDATASVWETVVYVNVGSATTVATYQDAFYTTPTSQFDASSSTNVYIQVTGVSSSDQYVTYMEQTSVKPRCVYMAPAPGAVTSGTICDPTSVGTGQGPVGSTLNVVWPVKSTYDGTYSVVVYDKTTSTRLGQVQVSFTPSTGITMRLAPDDTYANASPAPIPAPTAGTIYAWDGSNDQSTSGVALSTAGLASSPIWTITDPTGHVAGTSSGGTSYTYNFAAGGMLIPGSYPPQVFTATLYDRAKSAVIASQSFQIVGYHASTYFNIGSGNVQSMSLPLGSAQTSKLIFVNDGTSQFGAGNADGFRQIAFTTGVDFTATAGNSDGVMAYISGAQCGAACTQNGTAIDTAGNTWNVVDNCSTYGGFFTNGECAIFLTPQNPNVVLAPGASITLNSVLFTHDFLSNCLGFFGFGTNSCPGSTSVLPQHGQTWSMHNQTVAGNQVTFDQNIFTTESATAHVALKGAVTSAGSFKTANVNANLYKGYSTQVSYARTTPYSLATSAYNIYEVKVNNTSSNDAIQTIAVILPGSYGTTTPSSNNFKLDAAYGNPAGWALQIPCTQTGLGSTSNICIDGTASGKSIAAGSSLTFYIDANPPTTSFATSEWQIASVSPYVYSATADAANLSIPVGASGAPVTVDSLAFSMYSLDQSLMSATLSPSSAGQGTSPTETVTFTNTTSGADANPEYIDNVLITAPNSFSTSSNPSTTTPGWQYLGLVTSGSTNYWWFSACNNAQNTVANLPPTSTPLTAVFPQFTACTSAQLTRALGPGAALSMTFPLQNLNTSGTDTFGYYAHGANAGGWSSQGTFALTVTPVSASAGFNAAGGYPTATTVANGSIPMIGGNVDPTYGNAYTYTVKNTSATGAGNNITYMRIRIPGTDTSGANATDASGQYWQITGTGPTVTGSTDGCTVTAYQSATSAGADGYIDIGKTSGSACALKPGDTLTVTYTAKSPSSANDTYQFTTQNMNNAGITAGENWQYDTYVKVSLSVGLSVIVDPSNPGPGGSAPAPTCPGAYPCSFSGTTIDFGTVPNNTTNNYTDVARASIYITSSGSVTWNLSVQASSNPARTGAGATNELLTDVDSASSTQNPTHITFDQTSYAVVPTASSMTLANGSNVINSSTPFDVIQNLELSIGTEAITSHAVTITYTLITN